MLKKYIENKEKYKKALKSILKKQQLLGISRLLLICICLVSIFFYFNHSNNLLLAVVISSLLIFFFLVKIFISNENKIELLKQLIKINEDEIVYLKDGVLNFDSGEDYINHEHPFSYDLDIFGIGSIFQQINRTSTFIGRHRLSEFFIQQEVDKIQSLQEAVKELSSAIDWRQDYSAKGMMHISSEQDINNFKRWLTSPLYFKKRISMVIIYYLLPALTLISLGVGIITNNFVAASILFFVNLLVTLINVKRFRKEYLGLEKTSKILLSYSYLLKNIELSTFESSYLKHLKGRIYSHNTSAGSAISKLANILNKFDSQNNLLGSLITNGLFLSAVHNLLSLEKWRSKHAHFVDEWMDVIAEWDALNSLANFSINNIDFIFPIISKEPLFNLQGAGHPLIKKENRVLNDINFDNGKFIILTGSNMSGKSTFIRVIGINLLLFRMGAPVCATFSDIYPFEIFVSMKINDSLTNNESLFFAELKRLRRIIDQIEKGTPTFVLLDEILRGTNSNDKHTGTKSFIEKLTHYKAFGTIATHDLTISEMANQNSKYLTNKCFEVEIKDDRLFFDYKLKDGVCQKMSAVFLMKQMEII